MTGRMLGDAASLCITDALVGMIELLLSNQLDAYSIWQQ